MVGCASTEAESSPGVDSASESEGLASGDAYSDDTEDASCLGDTDDDICGEGEDWRIDYEAAPPQDTSADEDNAEVDADFDGEEAHDAPCNLTGAARREHIAKCLCGDHLQARVCQQGKHAGWTYLACANREDKCRTCFIWLRRLRGEPGPPLCHAGSIAASPSASAVTSAPRGSAPANPLSQGSNGSTVVPAGRAQSEPARPDAPVGTPAERMRKRWADEMKERKR